ncbi:hypothetical protein [Citrobacter freundii]|uniref:Uncharacterized protein n=1 Tax=Citrobacter freundii TaxID=546 RepID=A0A7G2IRF5_CITFR|nr:hypothetical protein [Citrobacter freundii]
MKRAKCHFLNYSHILMKTLYQDGLLIKKILSREGGKSDDDTAE